MKYLKLAVLMTLCLYLFACSSKNNKPEQVSQSSSTITQEPVQQVLPKADINSATPSGHQKEYTLKEDGLYVYSEGKPIYETTEFGCKKIIRKNYKYLPVAPANDLIEVADGPKTYQWCDVEYQCEDDYGKPSLKELGYDRHKEREIKPEDNRFGKQKTKERTFIRKEKKLKCQEEYLILPTSAFIPVSIREFLDNGVVVIGKHISRVVIKTLNGLPNSKWKDKLIVQRTKTCYDCCEKEVCKEINDPRVISDFRKIHFRENIFEFIEEDQMPNNTAYLSDEEFMRLTNDIHQLIPRDHDRTIHTVPNYAPGYYIIEYYNGDKLYDYICIQLIKTVSPPPSLWHPLEQTAPSSSANITVSKEKCYLILADFNSLEDARNFISKRPVGEALVYHLQNGKSVLAQECENRKIAENLLQRYLNMGFKKENIRIER